MACDYIHAIGMTQEEVEALLEAMCKEKGTVTRSTKKWDYLRYHVRVLTQADETTYVTTWDY